MSKKRQKQYVLGYYEQMVFCWSNELTAQERGELQIWEAFNLPKGRGTSDWPGWEKHLGKPPHSVGSDYIRRLA